MSTSTTRADNEVPTIIDTSTGNVPPPEEAPQIWTAPAEPTATKQPAE